jgi:hypothetical protein
MALDSLQITAKRAAEGAVRRPDLIQKQIAGPGMPAEASECDASFLDIPANRGIQG